MSTLILTAERRYNSAIKCVEDLAGAANLTRKFIETKDEKEHLRSIFVNTLIAATSRATFNTLMDDKSNEVEKIEDLFAQFTDSFSKLASTFTSEGTDEEVKS